MISTLKINDSFAYFTFTWHELPNPIRNVTDYLRFILLGSCAFEGVEKKMLCLKQSEVRLGKKGDVMRKSTQKKMKGIASSGAKIALTAVVTILVKNLVNKSLKKINVP